MGRKEECFESEKKHGISFDEAKTCFEDEHARVFFDVEHSKNEDRSILIGLSSVLRTLVVVFTERKKRRCLMKKEYDFSKMKAVKNPYAKILKKQVTIRLNSDTIDYFKEMAKEVGIPYQVLIDSYLTDCAVTRRKLNIRWQ